jgi:hypothetical protein
MDKTQAHGVACVSVLQTTAPYVHFAPIAVIGNQVESPFGFR